ncbi:MAG: Maf family protein [Clostridiales Family XIII bacterium]|jgi:septum formation protein|nr:Maf family protein [Clostridiales Family XIII bacterium]
MSETGGRIGNAGVSPLAGIPIVLASGSPRRIEMLRAHGIEPVVRPADIDESVPANLNVRQAVMYLALKKALASAEGQDACKESEPAFVIAADTVVFKEGIGIFGKPASPEEARRMLGALRAGEHTVCTGVAILRRAFAGTPSGNARVSSGEPVSKRVFCEEARVFFKDCSQSDIEAYIASGEPFDKAGGYAVQGGFGIYVDRIEGDVHTVMGLPWDRTERELAAMIAAARSARGGRVAETGPAPQPPFRTPAERS